MQKTISLLVENRFGVLARISGLFSGRGFNIDSLAVGETEDPNISRMTIVANGDENVIEQIIKQLNKLIDVIKVIDYKDSPPIERDLVLIKVNATRQNRAEIVQIADLFQAKIVDVGEDAVIIEMAGEEDRINGLINLLKPFGIKELSRTGIIALERAKK